MTWIRMSTMRGLSCESRTAVEQAMLSESFESDKRAKGVFFLTRSDSSTTLTLVSRRTSKTRAIRFLRSISMTWWLLALLGVGLYILYRLFKFWILDPWRIHRDFWSQGIPGRYTPLVGDLLRVRRAILADDPMSYSLEMTKKFGLYYHASFGPIARLHVSDVALVRDVLKGNARFYHKSHLMRLILGVLIGDENLLMAEDNIHSQHRRLIAPLFQHQNINSMISLMVEITNELLKKWTMSIGQSDQGEQTICVDVHQEMVHLTLDIVTGCVFGSGMMRDEQARETIHRGVTTTLDDVEKRTFNLIGIIPLVNQLPLAGERRIRQSKRDVRRVVQSIIDQRKKGFTKSACKGCVHVRRPHYGQHVLLLS